MGWLRQLMSEARPEVPSFGSLAVECLAHPGWPSGSRPKVRSLSALFSKLDRNIELEWLADREGVQQVLGSVLGCPLARIHQALEGALLEQDDETRVFRFVDAPRVRPLELREESLPPALPVWVATPRRWQRHFWKASDGDGTALVGTWLAARGLAHWVHAEAVDGALERLDPSCPNFVSLETPASEVEWPALPLCVAAPGAVPSGFQPIPSTPLIDALPALVDWLAARLPQDGRLDPAFTLEWLLRHPELATNFHAVVGLVGLIDELGVQSVRSKNAVGLAQAQLARRLRDALLPEEASHWIDEAFALLVGVATAAATRTSLPFTSPRPREAWIELIPEEYRQAVDVEWAKASLARAGKSVLVEVERALATAPPGAYRVVATMERAGLLVPKQRDLSTWVPEWVVQVVERQAVDELASSSAATWGEAALRGQLHGPLHDALVQRLLESDPSPIEAVLELDDPSNPASAAAVETATQALARALLAGAEFDGETLRAFRALQHEQAIRFADGRVLPRVFAGGARWVGAHHLGTWALDEALHGSSDADAAAAHPLALDEALAFLEAAEHADWVYAGYGLLGRVAEASHPEHLAAIPWTLLRGVQWTALSRLTELRHGIPACRFLCTRKRGGDANWTDLAQAFWQCWLEAGTPKNEGISAAAPGFELLWREVPVSVLRRLSEQEHPLLHEASTLPWSKQQLEVILQTTKRALPALLEQLDGSQLPATLAYALRVRDEAGLTFLWRRFEGAMCSALARLLDDANSGVLDLLLERAPHGATRAVTAKLHAAIAERGVAHPALESIRCYLSRCCRGREEGFAEAHALLHDIELRLGRVTVARGTRA